MLATETPDSLWNTYQTTNFSWHGIVSDRKAPVLPHSSLATQMSIIYSQWLLDILWQSVPETCWWQWRGKRCALWKDLLHCYNCYMPCMAHVFGKRSKPMRWPLWEIGRNPFHAHAPTNCIQWKHRFASRAGGVHLWKKIHVRNLPITPSISNWEKWNNGNSWQFKNSLENVSKPIFSWDITSSNFHQWHLWGTVEPPFMDPMSAMADWIRAKRLTSSLGRRYLNNSV